MPNRLCGSALLYNFAIMKLISGKTNRIIGVMITLLVCFSQPVRANMASPDFIGSDARECLSSRDMDILKERIHIDIMYSEDAYQHEKAHYKITYWIRTRHNGKQIPMVFDTMTDDYSFGGFSVEVDGKAVKVQSVERSGSRHEIDLRFMRANKGLLDNIRGFSNENAFRYFEMDLTAGIHRIDVEYFVNPSWHKGEWVKTLNYEYNLRPAAYWHSYGGLDLEISILSNVEGDYRLSFYSEQKGNGTSTSIRKYYKHHYYQLPGDVMKIDFNPHINNFAKCLIFINPFFLALIASALLVWLHLRYVCSRRNRKWALWIGIFAVPFISLIVYAYSFDLIGYIIGPAASDDLGDVFFMLLFLIYPILVLFYALVSCIIYSACKYRNKKSLQD